MKLFLKLFVSCLSVVVYSSCGVSRNPQQISKDMNVAIDTEIKRQLMLLDPTTEASAVCRPMSKSEVIEYVGSDVPFSCFKVDTKGFIPGKRYTLFRVNMLSGKLRSFDYIADSKGCLELEHIEHPAKAEVHILEQFMNGEMTGFAYIAQNDNPGEPPMCTAGVIAASPIEYRWDDNAYVCLWMADIHASKFLFAGKGFQPGERISFALDNHCIIMPVDVKADSNGRCYAAVLADVANTPGGKSTLEITRETVEGIGELRYFWGSHAKVSFKEPSGEE